MKKNLITMAMLGLLTTGYSQLTTNLVACYPLDCSEINMAATGSPLNGIPGAITCTAGHQNVPFTAYGFTGVQASNFMIPGTSQTKPANDITVSGWYNPTYAAAFQYIIFTEANACPTSNWEAYYLGVSAVNSTTFKFKVGKNKGAPTCQNDVIISPNMTFGNWYHVVFHIGPSNIEMTVNGTVVSPVSTSGGFNYASGTNVYLGGSGAATNTFPYTGRIDNVRFYDRALSAAEINYLYTHDPGCDDATNPDDPENPQGDCCLGNQCNATSNPLASDYEIPLNRHDFFFTKDDDLTDKVNVGYNCGTATLGKFNVLTEHKTNPGGSLNFIDESMSIYARNNFDGLGTAIRGDAYSLNATYANANRPIGVHGTASDGWIINIGVRGEGKKTLSTYGASYGGLFTSLETGNRHCIGGAFQARGGSMSNIGVQGFAEPSTGSGFPVTQFLLYYPSANISIYGASELNNSASGSPNQDWAGWFDGDVFVAGTGYYSGMTLISDRKFKKDIKSLESASDLISKLNPTSYFLKTDNEYGLGFSNKKQFGFISQEVETVLPDLVTEIHKPATKYSNGDVKTKEVDYKTLNYIGFIALLTKGMQEQQQEIDELKTMVQSLAGNNNEKNNSNTAGIPVTLSDKNAIVLNQNVPNPFAESTVITYNIPEASGRVQMIFTTNDGVIIKAVDIKEKGAGTLNIFANDLSHGLYTYSLIIDGKTVDSKKMIKE